VERISLLPSGLLAHRSGNEKRFVVRADEKLTAFLELGAAIRGGNCLDSHTTFLPNSAALNGFESGGGFAR
jgi:hypothetical protein